MTLQAGTMAPNFELHAVNNRTIQLENFRGQTIVLYFYPKDDTAGCTTEAISFRDLHDEFTSQGAVVIGISKDSLIAHEKFADKHALPFLLLSDPDAVVCLSYDVYKEKSMYGRKYMGIERTTYVINSDGKIDSVFSKVKVPGHAQAVLNAVTYLAGL